MLSSLLANPVPPLFLTHIVCQRHIWDKIIIIIIIIIIIADISNVMIFIISIFPLISKISNLLSKYMGTILSV